VGQVLDTLVRFQIRVEIGFGQSVFEKKGFGAQSVGKSVLGFFGLGKTSGFKL
jgi:hypothetical protein